MGEDGVGLWVGWGLKRHRGSNSPFTSWGRLLREGGNTLPMDKDKDKDKDKDHDKDKGKE